MRNVPCTAWSKMTKRVLLSPKNGGRVCGSVLCGGLHSPGPVLSVSVAQLCVALLRADRLLLSKPLSAAPSGSVRNNITESRNTARNQETHTHAHTHALIRWGP